MCLFPRAKSFSSWLLIGKNTESFPPSGRQARVMTSCINLTEPFLAVPCSLSRRENTAAGVSAWRCCGLYRVRDRVLHQVLGSALYSAVLLNQRWWAFKNYLMVYPNRMGPFCCLILASTEMFSSKCMQFRKAPQIILILSLPCSAYWYKWGWI